MREVDEKQYQKVWRTKNTITAEITDNLGKVLITETFKIDDGGYSSINLNLSELNSGMYYLKVVFRHILFGLNL